jgi:Protein of unknown function (DUF3379)
MNCLLYRRLKLVAPRNLSAQAWQHLDSCAPCSAFARLQDAFERDLEAAIHIPVSPTLADRIILNHRLRAGHGPQRYAIAASVLLAVSLALGLRHMILAPDPALIAASVEHVLTERIALERQDVVPDADVARALAGSGAALKKSLGQTVTYLSTCRVPGGLGQHLVLATDRGKVTLITGSENAIKQAETLLREYLSWEI